MFFKGLHISLTYSAIGLIIAFRIFRFELDFRTELYF